jgi:hypothetical protein
LLAHGGLGENCCFEGEIGGKKSFRNQKLVILISIADVLVLCWSENGDLWRVFDVFEGRLLQK